ncbi:MAG: hypothetical protein J0M34_05665 [Alphaproteobacteria bacterium]|nr:hypothetical protein [Alphaproteobacteria bacterium]
MRSCVALLGCAALLAACGIQRPLIAPKDIPAYEQKQQEKLQRKKQFEEDQLRKQQAQTPSI